MFHKRVSKDKPFYSDNARLGIYVAAWRYLKRHDVPGMKPAIRWAMFQVRYYPGEETFMKGRTA